MFPSHSYQHFHILPVWRHQWSAETACSAIGGYIELSQRQRIGGYQLPVSSLSSVIGVATVSRLPVLRA